MKRLPLPIVCMLAGCAIAPSPQQRAETEMLIAASALTKVAIAVDATTRYGNVPDSISGEALLSLATADDPALLEPLANFRVLVRRRGMNSEILLCTPDSTQALIEDAGCTAASDLHHWKATPLPKCDFTLTLDQVCRAK